jgi:hypothetical protein
MTGLLWRFLLLPLLHWLVVSLVVLALGRLADARRLAAEGAERALGLPVRARMAEVSLQVRRADGTLEPPRVYRTYRSPLMRWARAIKTAFTSNGD